METNSQLADRARGLARTLTYNEDARQSEIKHILHELAHRLDTASVRVFKMRGSLRNYVCNALGKQRVMTWKEWFAYKMFNAVPARV